MYPNAILLNTSAAVKRIRELPHSQPQEVWRMFITYALEDMVDCLRDCHSSLAKLKEWAEQIDRGRYKQYFDQHALLSHTLFWAGVEVRTELQNVKAYEPDGILRYTYYPVHAPTFNDMLLIREQELPAPQENNNERADHLCQTA